jgi:hypothetical protein
MTNRKPYKITYIRGKVGNPEACVVYSIDEQNKQIKWQMTAFDHREHFDRARGRQQAIGRFFECPKVNTLTNDKPNTANALTELFVTFISNKSLPTRVRNCVKHGWPDAQERKQLGQDQRDQYLNSTKAKNFPKQVPAPKVAATPAPEGK